jgi:hypothetical protein
VSEEARCVVREVVEVAEVGFGESGGFKDAFERGIDGRRILEECCVGDYIVRYRCRGD